MSMHFLHCLRQAALPSVFCLLCIPTSSPAAVPGVEQTLQAFEAARGQLDPAPHKRADQMLAALENASPNDPQVIALQAWQAMNQHRFKSALQRSAQALVGRPGDTIALALHADASTELGRYDNAIADIEQLVAHGAVLPGWIRAAHIRRLYGDAEGAATLLEKARPHTEGNPDDARWLEREYANLLWHRGDAIQALDHLNRSAADDIGSMILRARIEQALRRNAQARADWTEVARRAPLAEALIALWQLAPHNSRDQRQLAYRLEGMAKLDEAQGGLSRRDFIQWFALTGRLDRAEHLARLELDRRPDIFSQAQLGWVLARQGRQAEAGVYLCSAYRLHSIDAQLAAYRMTLPADALACPAQNEDVLQ